MQPRNMKYENLYEEMKSLLNSSANKKYNLTQIQSKEKKCIEIINYEKGNLEYIITLSAGVLSTMNRKEKYKSRPELPNEFKECKNLMDEKMNTDYYGFRSSIWGLGFKKIEKKIMFFDIYQISNYQIVRLSNYQIIKLSY